MDYLEMSLEQSYVPKRKTEKFFLSSFIFLVGLLSMRGMGPPPHRSDDGGYENDTQHYEATKLHQENS